MDGYVNLGLGNRKQAISWLRKAAEERDALLPCLNVWCPFDTLRSDPRFQPLRRRMNFPETAGSGKRECPCRTPARWMASSRPCHRRTDRVDRRGRLHDARGADRQLGLRITILKPHLREVLVQGGKFFPERTRACLNGSTFGGSCLKIGWVGLGLHLEFHAGDQWIITCGYGRSRSRRQQPGDRASRSR